MKRNCVVKKRKEHKRKKGRNSLTGQAFFTLTWCWVSGFNPEDKSNVQSTQECDYI